MPNIKSQIKRAESNDIAHAKNSAAKNEVRTACKKVEAAVEAGNKEEAAKALPIAISLLDKIAQAGTISINNANRKKAHLQHIVGAMK